MWKWIAIIIGTAAWSAGCGASSAEAVASAATAEPLLGEIATNTVTGVGDLEVICVRDPEGNIIELQRRDC